MSALTSGFSSSSLYNSHTLTPCKITDYGILTSTSRNVFHIFHSTAVCVGSYALAMLDKMLLLMKSTGTVKQQNQHLMGHSEPNVPLKYVHSQKSTRMHGGDRAASLFLQRTIGTDKH